MCTWKWSYLTLDKFQLSFGKHFVSDGQFLLEISEISSRQRLSRKHIKAALQILFNINSEMSTPFVLRTLFMSFKNVWLKAFSEFLREIQAEYERK